MHVMTSPRYNVGFAAYHTHPTIHMRLSIKCCNTWSTWNECWFINVMDISMSWNYIAVDSTLICWYFRQTIKKISPKFQFLLSNHPASVGTKERSEMMWCLSYKVAGGDIIIRCSYSSHWIFQCRNLEWAGLWLHDTIWVTGLVWMSASLPGGTFFEDTQSNFFSQRLIWNCCYIHIWGQKIMAIKKRW